ncbi:TraB/GumN family protein [Shimia haliotis]|uniref:TraB family protein n=1 Tax=Shimia haliotis TaxID=1280847 RepID=A0A1I4F692_9RHOB|nr:TraB/GumN family protein [Shimia haliotis]SFL12973.1 hypothetical protein SAMN04488036_105216 [Shimia haliotis]
MRSFLSALVFLLSSSVAQAACDGPNAFDLLPEQTQADLQAQAARAPFHQGLLWSVEKNGVTSTLVGTLHLSHPTHQRTLQTLAALPEQPQKVYLEFTAPAQKAFQQHLLDNPGVYLIESGDSLIDILGDTHWQAISAELKKRGIPPFMAARYQPWFLGLTLAMPPCAMAEIAAGKRGLDHLIEQEATQKQIPMASLDTTETLLSILAAPLEEQLEELRWSLELDLMDSGESQMPAMMALYEQEDIQLIWELGQHMTLAQAQDDATASDLATLLAEVEAELIEKRNRLWAEQVIPELAQTPSLIAVGALHLPGENGLLRMLQRAGFSITRLDRNGS